MGASLNEARIRAHDRGLRNLHLWIVAAIVLCGTLVYYAEYLPYLSTLERAIEPTIPFAFARYSLHRILSIVPVAYAAFVFGLRGGLFSSLVIAFLLVPRALLASSGRDEALIEVAAFLIIGVLVSWLIDRQKREKEQHARTIKELESARKELLYSVKVVTESERRLAALNRVSTLISQSLELNQVLENAVDTVKDVMHVEAVMVFLLDEESCELVLSAHRGISDDFARGVDRLKLGEGFNGKVAETGEALFVEDVTKEPSLARSVVVDEKIRSQLIVPMKSKGRVVGTMCLSAQSGHRAAPEEAELMVAIGNQIGVAVENARLYRRERTISQQLRLSERRYRGLFENAKESILVLDLEGRIADANKACEELTGSSVAEMVGTNFGKFLTEESVAKVRKVIRGMLNGRNAGGFSEIRLVKKNGAEGIAEFTAGLVVQGGRPIGVQVIVRDITEERRMQQNLRFYLSQVVKAQEDERKRVARELHDDTAQSLAVLSRSLEAMAVDSHELPLGFQERLRGLRQQSDKALEGVRLFSQDLRPSILDDLGLFPALEWLADELKKQGGIDAGIKVLGKPVRFSPEAELILFRIAQEALTNAKKHSQATAVEITVELSDDRVTLAVADNGKGFDVPRQLDQLAAAGRLGIMGMQERARLLGGNLTICSELGHGTTVLVEIPAE